MASLPCPPLPRRLLSLLPLGLLMYLVMLYVSHAPAPGLVNQYAASSDSLTAASSVRSDSGTGYQGTGYQGYQPHDPPRQHDTLPHSSSQSEAQISPAYEPSLSADQLASLGLLKNVPKEEEPAKISRSVIDENRPAEVVWDQDGPYNNKPVVSDPEDDAGILEFVNNNSPVASKLDAVDSVAPQGIKSLDDSSINNYPVYRSPGDNVAVLQGEPSYDGIEVQQSDKDLTNGESQVNDISGLSLSQVGIVNDDIDLANDGALAANRNLINTDDMYRQSLEQIIDLQNVHENSDSKSISTRNAGRKLQASHTGSLALKSSSADIEMAVQQQLDPNPANSVIIQDQQLQIQNSGDSQAKEDTKSKLQSSAQEAGDAAPEEHREVRISASTSSVSVSSSQGNQSKPEDKQQHKPEDKPEDKVDGKPEEKSEDKPEEKTKVVSSEPGKEQSKASSAPPQKEAVDAKEAAKAKEATPAKAKEVTPAKAKEAPPAKAATKKIVEKKAGSGIAINYLKNKNKIKDVYAPGFRVAHPDQCPRMGQGTKLLAFITSAPGHSSHRTAIRQTWGSFANRKDITMIFVIGTTTNKEHQTMVDHENRLFGDVVQSNNVDSYQNLTLKTAAMFEWAKTYCPRAAFMLKTDDDMFINMPLLLSYIDSKRNQSRSIFGRLAKGWKPIRNKKSKYYVDIGSYSKTTYPDFLTGPAYLFTRDIVTDVYNRVLDTPFFFLEDVLVTGIVSEALKIKRIGEARFRNERVRTSQICKLLQAISIHMVKYEEQFKIYEITMNGQTKCKQKKQ